MIYDGISSHFSLGNGIFIYYSIYINMELTPKDLEKLKYVLQKVKEGTATTFDKASVEQYLESIISPKCAICRGVIEGDIVIINDRKMHTKCSKKYKA